MIIQNVSKISEDGQDSSWLIVSIMSYFILRCFYVFYIHARYLSASIKSKDLNMKAYNLLCCADFGSNFRMIFLEPFKFNYPVKPYNPTIDYYNLYKKSYPEDF